MAAVNRGFELGETPKSYGERKTSSKRGTEHSPSTTARDSNTSEESKQTDDNVTCVPSGSPELSPQIDINKGTTGEMPRSNLSVEEPHEVTPIMQRKQNNRILNLIQKQLFIRHSTYITLIGVIIFVIIIWTLLYLVLDKEVTPTGDLFRLIVLIGLAYIVGIGVSYARLPALIGMLATGVLLRTIGFFKLSGFYPEIVTTSRNVALTVILIKAGLGLDATALIKLKFVILKLSLIPCTLEAITAAVVSHYIIGFPWLWGFLLGFLLSPISPAVVVPTLLSLKEQGYGEEKGIATLVIAASSIDDIYSISAFGIFLSEIFSQGENMVMKIAHGPLELIAGLVVGIAWGLLAACFPHKNDPYVVSKRTAMIAIGGLCAVLGSIKIDYAGSGPLACITSSFIAAVCWKIQGWDSEEPSPVANMFSIFWSIMQPVLFGLVGTEIDLYSLVPSDVGYGIAVVLISVVLRVMVCFLSLLGGHLNLREMAFVNFAWLPKATVQAALGPKAVYLLKNQSDPSQVDIDYAQMVLTIAVLAIIITAPIGAVAIAISGPCLLTKKAKQEVQQL